MQRLTQSYISRIEQFVLRFKLDHVAFWLVYAFISAYVFYWGAQWFDGLIDTMVLLTFHAAVSYFNNYFLVPRFLLTKQYITYLSAVILSVLGVCFPLTVTAHIIIQNKDLQSLVWSSAFLFFIGLSVLFTVIFTMVLKFVKQWYKDQKSTRELQQVQLQTELKFLKSQINPHFLFNSLNNLYALTLKKSDLAPQLVLRLSDILRYILYESNAGTVSLAKEMKHVKDYVEIERLRLGNAVNIDLNLPDNDLLSGFEIEPMLYLTLVENAFKHSENVIPEKRYVKILAEPVEKGFRFLIENSFNPSNKSKERGGIGLQNIKKRLILTYPNKHTLNSLVNNEVYSVDLKIYW